MYTTGNVGLGVASPAYQLDLSTDDARKLTTTTWLTGSDRRIKDAIEDADLDRCCEVVRSIPLKRFAWREDYLADAPGIDRHALGWIAQDVKEVFPNAVSVSRSHGYDDFLSLDSDQLIKTMWGALSRALQRLDTLESTRT
jgi:hypothetical protein